MNNRSSGDDKVNMVSHDSFDVLLEANEVLEASEISIQSLRQKRRNLQLTTSQTIPAVASSDDLQALKKRRSELMQISTEQFKELKILTEAKQQQVDALKAQAQALQEKVAASGIDGFSNSDLPAASISPVNFDAAHAILDELNVRLNSQATERSHAATLQTYHARYTRFFEDAETATRRSIEQITAENKQASDLLAATKLPVIKQQ